MRTFFYCYRHYRRSGWKRGPALKRAVFVATQGF